MGPSETGSLDRAKAALERRKKGSGAISTSVLGGPLGSALDGEPTVSGRVEGTRVNPDLLIAELLRTTRLDQVDSKEGTFIIIKLFYYHKLFVKPACHIVESRNK